MISRRLLLGGLFLFVVGFAAFALVHMFPPQPYGLADDWRVFYAAGQVVAHGGNAYDSSTMHVAEQAAQHYASVQPSLDDFADLPIVGVVLRAFAWLPYWWSYAVFTALGLSIAVLAMRAWLHQLGWSRGGQWLIGALLSWPLLLGVLSGQFDLLLLGGLVASLILMRRGAASLAGLCMVVVLLKPHILWPLPILVASAWASDLPRLRRFVGWAAGVLVGGTGLGFLLVAHSGDFFQHLLQFDSRVAGGQPDLSGIPGLLTHLPDATLLGDAIGLVGVLGVLAFAVVAVRDPRFRQLGPDQRALIPLTGLAFWLALTPYGHPNDDVLLFPLVAVIVGEMGRRLDPTWLEAGVAGSLALIAALVVSTALGAALLTVAVGAGVLRRDRISLPAVAALALPALLLLPDIWPFHLLTVSPTPVAVSLVAVAGALVLVGELENRTSPRRVTSLALQPRGG